MHSCDQCRQGKRACDARILGIKWRRAPSSDSSASGDGSIDTCSNCKRYKKTCTFNWLSTKRTKSAKKWCLEQAGNRTISVATEDDRENDSPIHHLSLRQPEVAPDHLTEEDSAILSAVPDVSGIPLDGEGAVMLQNFQDVWQCYNDQPIAAPSFAGSLEDTPDQQYGGPDPELDGFNFSPGGFTGFLLPNTETPKLVSKVDLCVLSDNIASEHTRSMMTQNLIRIYHDSMENALSCWLTERNCPYNAVTTSRKPAEGLLLDAMGVEWGPKWSNRICTRVCRLDRVYSLVRGRRLSAAEDKTASRALHTTIMAFASQWAQNSQARMGSPDSSVAQHERSIRETLWSQARHALSDSVGVPSFRVAFANIVFSLAQRPLDVGEDVEVDDLLENDCAPVFLEAALRQMFTFRYKLTRLQRQATEYSKQPNGELQVSRDPILTNPEYSETFNFLFWMGVMFDTLTAAMHQRPPVISDEDSQIPCVSPSKSPAANTVDLDGWTMASNHAMKKQDNLWGDLFLLKHGTDQGPRLARWPFSYEEAAERLSDATPVKVLLFRRVTHLQKLIYRDARPEVLENDIQGTLLVYQHWNRVYRPFMLDCMANHQDLMPRIQSWYVILSGHWHLATLLLADTLETIDQGRMGRDSRREYREAIDLVTTLRRENALMVSGIAQCSLSALDLPSAKLHDFHDSVNEVALLTEPWTSVLIRCFTKAACFLLTEVDASPPPPPKWDSPSEHSRRHFANCINGLWVLGRKSDMAFMAARSLSNSLHRKVR